MLTPINLKTEYTTNPLGIESKNPRFSWELTAERNNQMQNAFEILVSSSEAFLQNDLGDLWSSHKVDSAKQTNIEYEGSPLQSGQRAFWKIRAWDREDRVGLWSQPAWFEMALLDQIDWLGDWIGFPAGSPGKALFVRRDLEIDTGLINARAYVAGLGLYELSINGKKVGDRVLEPAQTDPSKTIFYSVYDITDNLTTGKNTLGFILGSGWHGVCRLKAQIRLDYPGERPVWIATGCSSFDTQVQKGGWQVASGPIVSNSLFDGEEYDARLENSGWDTPRPSSPLDHWVGPVVMEPPAGRLTVQVVEPIRVVQTLAVRLVSNPAPDIFVYDTGQNLSGWARIKVKGKRGTRIALKFAESLYPDGTANQENLRSAKAQDVYILKGVGIETWEPHFTYHGFRYIQVEGFPGIPDEDTIQARVVRSDVCPVGELTCDHTLINRIHTMAWWTEASNLHGLPTDCPQRDERMGWLNDMTVRVEEALFNFDLVRLYEKWTNDICDAQDPKSGAITDTAPYRWGGRPADPVSASFLRAGWLLYRRWGDRGVLEKNFGAYQKWVDFLLEQSRDGILQYSYYGDWAPPISEGILNSLGSSAISQNTPGPLVSTAFMVFSTRLLSACAEVLGYTKAVEHYSRLVEISRQAFQREFWNPVSGGYGSNNQACNVLALYFDLVPGALRPAVVKNLVEDIHSHDDHLTTGNLCTRFIFDVLTTEGHVDLAFRLLTQTTYPSWGYMLENGATTVWERWEKATGSGMNSHNHPMYAAVDAWLYRAVGGLQPDDNLAVEGAAFERFRVYPMLAGLLRHGRASLETVKGRIEVDWNLEKKGELRIDVDVPVGSRAEIFVPFLEKQPESLWIDGQLAWQEGEVRPIPGWEIAPELAVKIAFRLVGGSGRHMIKMS